MFNSFGKVSNCLIDITVLYAFFDTVIKVTLQNDLTDFVKSPLGSVNLHKNIFTRDVLIDHPINSIDLTHDFFQSFMKIVSIHTLAHRKHSEKNFLKYNQPFQFQNLSLFCRAKEKFVQMLS